MRKLIILLFIILSVSGCSTLNFKKINYVALDNVDPKVVREELIKAMPERQRVVSTIVFQYKWQSFTALGFTDIDTKQKTFGVVCLNMAGVKLFELSGDSNSLRPRFVLKELIQRGDLPRAVGDDIRRVYFDIAPSESAKVIKERYRIIFKEQKGSGYIDYMFAGKDRYLVEKRCYENNKRLWTVFYYGYILKEGKLYPAQVLFKHHRFGYNLIIRLKEVRL